ncbi:MAG: pyridoxamine 5'-phosphate oxidase family protein, partial [Acidimicrobiia bacterium]
MPAPSPRTEIRRDERSAYDRPTIDAILDEAILCHVGFLRDGAPVVFPMLHARVGDDLLLHASPASSFARALSRTPEICVEVTILDGLVLARSAFNHSANYRSVVLFGSARKVTDLAERAAALDAFTDKLVPGRRPHLRSMTEKEVRATAVFSLPIGEASAKVRSGPPVDEEEDYHLPIWAGVIPVVTSYGAPLPDPRNLPDATVPELLG